MRRVEFTPLELVEEMRNFALFDLQREIFSWGSENMTHKVRILDVVYNASNNELVRTKTLVKGCIVEIDASEFKKGL